AQKALGPSGEADLPAVLGLAEVSRDGALQCQILRGVCGDRRAELRGERLRIYRQKRELLNAGKAAADLKKSVLQMQKHFARTELKAHRTESLENRSARPSPLKSPERHDNDSPDLKQQAPRIPARFLAAEGRPRTAPESSRWKLAVARAVSKSLASDKFEDLHSECTLEKDADDRDKENELYWDKGTANDKSSPTGKSRWKAALVKQQGLGRIAQNKKAVSAVARLTADEKQASSHVKNYSEDLRTRYDRRVAADVEQIRERHKARLLQQGADRLRALRLEVENRILQEQLPDPAYHEEIDFLRAELASREAKLGHAERSLRRIVAASSDQLRKQLNEEQAGRFQAPAARPSEDLAFSASASTSENETWHQRSQQQSNVGDTVID
ncbi:unnamed protein product, partial [Amoebophrya sp. A25]